MILHMHTETQAMSQTDSREGGAKGEAQGTEPDTQGTDKQATQGDNDGAANMENVTPGIEGDGVPGVAEPTREESRADATRRWRNGGIAETVAVFRDRVREEYRASHPDRPRREAHDHAWSRAIAEFPPPGVESVVVEPAPADPPPAAPAPESSGLSGLGDIPADWPDLPDNAQLAVEVQWVQANRVRVRVGDSVDLSKARSPAPSWAALSWLETAILYPAKWADITAKATSTQADERESVRRERVSIDEVRSLLAEMLEARDDVAT